MAREPVPTWYFALVVVRLGHRFLLVQENKEGHSWYLPAGRVEPGETIAEAAVRETMEEAGVAIALSGILRIEHSPRDDGTARVRVFFLGHPVDDRAPKSVADRESLRAAWVSLDELPRYPLRGEEVRDVFEAVEAGAAVHPLNLLVRENTRFG